ncbi:MAG: hypothetical protein IT307_12695 [Chloroflexi bacterium]|nr:hypothetical protein [Chloroflexota bacterium]
MQTRSAATDTARAAEVAARRPMSAPSRAPRLLAGLLFFLAIFALAVTPRLLGRDVFMTSDEDSWMRRTGGFTYGLSIGQLGRTYQNGHPGVTTMWLSALGQGFSNAIRFADPVTGARYVTRVPGFFQALVDARRAFAVANALLVAAIGLAAWRLLGIGPASVGAGLLALDPFDIAHSQLVHMDGLLAGLVALAALCAAVYWVGNGRRAWLLAAGGLTGLALLTKAPAIFLLAYVPFLAAIRGHAAPRRTVVDLALWAGLAMVVFVALWPSMWVNPLSSLTRMVAFVRETGGEPDEVGSFFLGNVSQNPGPLFYPVALAFRLTPLGTIGLLSAVILAWPMRRMLRPRSPALLAIGLYVLGFLLLVTIAQKKFDRYGLPTVPGVLLLAGFGWWLLWRRVKPLLAPLPIRAAATAALLALAAFQTSAPLSVFPYYMAYFNPLLGGGPGAAATTMVGNGEGMDQAAAWIAAQPDRDRLWIVSHSFDLLLATCQCDGEPLRDRIPSDADYVIVYGRRIQMHRWGAGMEQYFVEHMPVERFWINGIEMAALYPGPHLAKLGR